MKRSLVRAVGSAAIVAAIFAAGVVLPSGTASAAPLVTVTGHVTDAAGDPLTGMTVAGGCECDMGPKGTDKTSASGRFTLTLAKKFASGIIVYDPKSRYIDKFVDGTTGTKTSTGYRLDVTLERRSRISGKLLDDAGQPVGAVEVIPYDAKTGKQKPEYSTVTDFITGTFTLSLPTGQYRIRFVGDDDPHYAPIWFGQVDTEGAAPTVSAGPGEIVKRVDATVIRKQTIDGTITVNGQAPIDELDEHAVVELRDATGALVGTDNDGHTFSFVGLHDGVYTLTTRPSTDGAAFFAPDTRTVELANGKPATVDIDLAVQPSTQNPSSTTIDLSRSNIDNEATRGKAFHSRIRFVSYGTVGGTVRFTIGGKTISKKNVPASGIVVFSTRFSGVATGRVVITAHYSGTSTTKPLTDSIDVVTLKR